MLSDGHDPVLAFASDPPPPSECPAGSTFRYQRQEPELTLLRRIVRENLATFLREAADRYPSGDLPAFISEEFSRRRHGRPSGTPSLAAPWRQL